MKQVITAPDARPIKVWTDDIDANALAQLKNVARLPFVHPHGVVAMPDVHYGIGATVGSVIATEGAIIPAAVGVDIGCGMNAVRTSLRADDLPDSLSSLRHAIERDVPLGAGGKHRDARVVAELFNRLPAGDQRWGLQLILGATDDKGGERAASQLGTLGSGNHFIEICLDENDDVWIMLHSGSRGTGNIIGRQFIERAKQQMEKYYVTLPDKDLAYFPVNTTEFDDYMMAVGWCQDYALENRRIMMENVVRAMRAQLKPFES